MPGKQQAKPRLTRREKKAQISGLIKTANESKDLLSHIQPWTIFKDHGLDLKIECARSKEIESSTFNEIFNLLKNNMQVLYEKSDWGWDETQKMEELQDENARFLLAKDCDGKLVGFSHFRFDIEEHQPILYCYELQIYPEIQRKGVGKHMMDMLFLIAYHFKLVKIVLTVFKHNSAGIDFYMKALTFRYDETCPKEEEEKCYVIFCKFVDKSELQKIKKR
ncbi:N-alpha-acetyltransferase 40-like [Uloborus diversus]|uniref:N-alpha-acetyltransferase 40-like n=1 Tax=Uloborus diversus TaxID=327109 RepID=UPI0024091841|nr:N-alpha-acetyltransferase 40-like [Uloborus diversus]